FPDVVAPMDLYRYPTLNQLTEYIVDRVHSSNVETPLSVFEENGAIDLDQLNYAQLNELIESELKELELTYE
ncbi:MAG: hypothetical protein PSV35_05500, partial [bacterium]|nr:hypothetical protein [bacterium]